MKALGTKNEKYNAFPAATAFIMAASPSIC
jgi:hypothetical protein